jgi:hypothetical protein
MEVKIERLFEKLGRLHLSQDLLMEENAALRAVQEAIKVEIVKIEKEGEAVVTNVLDRLKKLL